MGEIAQNAGLYADSLLDELAVRKLRFHHPELARQWAEPQREFFLRLLTKYKPCTEFGFGLSASDFWRTPHPAKARDRCFLGRAPKRSRPTFLCGNPGFRNAFLPAETAG